MKYMMGGDVRKPMNSTPAPRGPNETDEQVKMRMIELGKQNERLYGKGAKPAQPGVTPTMVKGPMPPKPAPTIVKGPTPQPVRPTIFKGPMSPKPAPTMVKGPDPKPVPPTRMANGGSAKKGVPAHSSKPMIRRNKGGLTAMPKGKC